LLQRLSFAIGLSAPPPSTYEWGTCRRGERGNHRWDM